jgi:hypothetical protein
MTQPQATIGKSLLKVHEALVEDLEGLESVRTAASDGSAGLPARLDRTRALLADHFRFEEEGGGLSAVLGQHPNAERAIRRLTQEHGELLMSLDALRAEARAVAASCQTLHQKVAEWTHKVRLHEQNETLLVEDSFNQDTCGGE